MKTCELTGLSTKGKVFLVVDKDFPIAYSEHSTKAAANRWRLKNNRTATTKVEEL
jgi:hypothetical protein